MLFQVLGLPGFHLCRGAGRSSNRGPPEISMLDPPLNLEFYRYLLKLEVNVLFGHLEILSQNASSSAKTNTKRTCLKLMS